MKKYFLSPCEFYIHLYRQKKKENRKNETNQTNISIVHYYRKYHYESLSIFAIQI